MSDPKPGKNHTHGLHVKLSEELIILMDLETAAGAAFDYWKPSPDYPEQVGEIRCCALPVVRRGKEITCIACQAAIERHARPDAAGRLEIGWTVTRPNPRNARPETRETAKPANLHFSDCLKAATTGAIAAGMLVFWPVMWLTQLGLEPVNLDFRETTETTQNREFAEPETPIQTVVTKPQFALKLQENLRIFLTNVFEQAPEETARAFSEVLGELRRIPEGLEELWSVAHEPAEWYPEEPDFSPYLHLVIPEAKRTVHIRHLDPDATKADQQRTDPR